MAGNKARSLQFVRDIVYAGFVIDSGSDAGHSFIVPVDKRAFVPPVLFVGVRHDSEMLSKKMLDISVYITAAPYEHKKIRNLGFFFRLAGICQEKLLSLGYDYDQEYTCYDGTVVLWKQIAASDAMSELKRIHSLLTI